VKFLWCEEENVHLPDLGCVGHVPKIPPRIRCPKCKQRFKPIVRDCQDGIPGGCWHVYMPKHKGKVPKHKGKA
jgi:hypothetical protein